MTDAFVIGSAGLNQPKERLGANFEVICPTSSTHDGIRCRRHIDPFPEQMTRDVYTDDLAQDEPGREFRAVGIAQCRDLRDSAFEADGAFGDPWRGVRQEAWRDGLCGRRYDAAGSRRRLRKGSATGISDTTMMRRVTSPKLCLTIGTLPKKYPPQRSSSTHRKPPRML